jgi:hypothetical protein
MTPGNSARIASLATEFASAIHTIWKQTNGLDDLEKSSAFVGMVTLVLSVDVLPNFVKTLRIEMKEKAKYQQAQARKAGHA